MIIDSQQFCALSTSAPWLNWLKHNHIEFFEDLMEHHKSGKSCAANRVKMTEILDYILKDQSNTDALIKFLQENYPYTIKSDAIEVNESKNRHNVFDVYDPALLTFPRRMIMDNVNKDIVDNWCADKGFCDYIILDGVAYIEYLTQSQMHLKDQIPASYWQVAVYRKKNKL